MVCAVSRFLEIFTNSSQFYLILLVYAIADLEKLMNVSKPHTKIPERCRIFAYDPIITSTIRHSLFRPDGLSRGRVWSMT